MGFCQGCRVVDCAWGQYLCVMWWWEWWDSAIVCLFLQVIHNCHAVCSMLCCLAATLKLASYNASCRLYAMLHVDFTPCFMQDLHHASQGFMPCFTQAFHHASFW